MFDDLLFVKYVKGGRNPQIGLDCYGLVKEVYHRIGIELPEYDSPESCEGIDDFVREKKGTFEKLDNIQAYALVLFVIKPPYETHIGTVLADRKTFIHVLKKTGCCIERLNNPFWVKRIGGFYQWRG